MSSDDRDDSEDEEASATMEDAIEDLTNDSNDIEDDVTMYCMLEQQEQAAKINNCFSVSSSQLIAMIVKTMMTARRRTTV